MPEEIRRECDDGGKENKFLKCAVVNHVDLGEGEHKRKTNKNPFSLAA